MMKILRISLTALCGLSTIAAPVTAQTLTFAPGGSTSARPPNNHVATRCISGKMKLVPLSATSGMYYGQSAATNSTGMMFDSRVAAPGAFDAVRILIPNMAGSPVTGVKASLSLVDSHGGWQGGSPPPVGGNVPGFAGQNPNNSALAPFPNSYGWSPNSLGSVSYGFRRFTFGDYQKGEIDLPAALDVGREIPSYTATDWMPVESAARTDGGALPAVVIRVEYPRTGATPASGATSSSPGVTMSSGGFASWGIDGSVTTSRNFNDGQYWQVFSENTDSGLENGTNFQGSNTPATLPTPVTTIVQFRTKAEVQTIVYLNDSIGEFNSGGENGNPAALRGARAAAAATGKVISWCNFAIPSGPLAYYGGLLKSLLDHIQPQVIWVKPLGPNEAMNRLLFAGNLSYALALGRKYQSKMIVAPFLAVNANVYNGGAPWEAIRLDGNGYLASNASTLGYTFVNEDISWSAGGSFVSGQQQPNPANTSDGVHPTEAGNAAMTAVNTAAFTAVLTQK